MTSASETPAWLPKKAEDPSGIDAVVDAHWRTSLAHVAVIGADLHARAHTFVDVEEVGRRSGERARQRYLAQSPAARVTRAKRLAGRQAWRTAATSSTTSMSASRCTRMTSIPLSRNAFNVSCPVSG
jgi:hypothetical protein